MKIAELMANKLEKLFQEASLENIKADTSRRRPSVVRFMSRKCIMTWILVVMTDTGTPGRGNLYLEATPVDDKLVPMIPAYREA